MLKNEEPDSVLTIAHHEYLKFHLPEDAFAKNLRGYISTVTPALKCRMDMRRTDGGGMIFKYASKYATKGHNAYDGDVMHSRHVCQVTCRMIESILIPLFGSFLFASFIEKRT